MAKKYLQLKFGPLTLNLPSLVGQPIYRDSIIGLDKQSDVDLLIGEGNNFHTVYEDESTRNWFEDVTASYTKAPTATVEAPLDEAGEEEEEESEGGEEQEAGEQATGTAPAAAPASQRRPPAKATNKAK